MYKEYKAATDAFLELHIYFSITKALNIYLAKRLTATLAIALKTFWDGQQGGLVPFFFYNTIEGPFDATGNATLGRYTVVFRGAWSQTTGILRTDVPQLELVEVA